MAGLSRLRLSQAYERSAETSLSVWFQTPIPVSSTNDHVLCEFVNTDGTRGGTLLINNRRMLSIGEYGEKVHTRLALAVIGCG